MTLKTCIAINTAKAVAGLVSSLKLGAGTSLPGKLARKIDPDVLYNLGRQINKQVIAVSGTNGKTTTCGLLAQLLREADQQVVHNQLGANMVPGITAALLHQSSLCGSLKADYGVLEVDEASLKVVASELEVHWVVVTNLFRDQLDRYGELDTTAKLIRQGIDSTVANGNVGKAKTLVLNADDPLVARIARMGQGESALLDVHYFGVKKVVYPYSASQHELSEITPLVRFNQESASCPACGGELAYDYPIYGHLGHYHCKACQFTRPTPKVEAEEVQVRPEGSTVILRVGEERFTLEVPLPGLFNVYNLLAAVSVLVGLKLPLSVIQPALDHYESVFGRAEKKMLHGKKALVMLIKNPVGASEVIKLVAGDPKGRLWIALNDNYADGRDVSWIWDAQFELIAYSMSQPEHQSKRIMVSGVRAADMAIRLKYAGVPANRIHVENDLMASVELAAKNTQDDETLYLMPTYTALLDLRPLLASSPSR